MRASRISFQHFCRLVAAAAPLLCGTGCLVTTSQLDQLQREVATLNDRVEARDKELQASLARANEQSEELDSVLRSRAASLGVNVDDLGLDVAQLRGETEDARNDIAALLSETQELRAGLDQRVSELEHRFNRETEIPEGQLALRKEADRLFREEDWSQARRLYRIYLSRYPSGKKESEIRFSIGQTLYNENKHRSALSEFYWIVQNARTDPAIYNALYYSGLAFSKIGQCDKATAYFNALVEDPQAPKKYQTSAADQIAIFKADTGKICTGRKADGGRSDEVTE
jgi:TolA-binding protein